jgi:archaellum component FlaF (FlaF/FlaG flagellin family)
MALVKEVVIDQITVTENGAVLVREVTRIMEDGIEISKQYHRTSLIPGNDISSLPKNVQNICNAAWTAEVIDAYNAQQGASL